jgi:NitT/TauT family transport system permease protein
MRDGRAVLSRRALYAGRVASIAALVAAWWLASRIFDERWTSDPIAVATRLLQWGADDLWAHVATTLYEMVAGLAIGIPAGALLGIWLGWNPAVARAVRPLVVAANSIPVVALAPLLIMWLGLGLAPKIVLVALVGFFLVFFSTYQGVSNLPPEWLDAARLMGASRGELLRKVVVPGSMTWILAGLRTALPYALIAATIGEMMLAQRGLGFLVNRSGAQLDMTGLYAALLVLMFAGVAVAGGGRLLERRLLRWRKTIDDAAN